MLGPTVHGINVDQSSKNLGILAHELNSFQMLDFSLLVFAMIFVFFHILFSIDSSLKLNLTSWKCAQNLFPKVYYFSSLVRIVRCAVIPANVKLLQVYLPRDTYEDFIWTSCRTRDYSSINTITLATDKIVHPVPSFFLCTVSHKQQGEDRMPQFR